MNASLTTEARHGAEGPCPVVPTDANAALDACETPNLSQCPTTCAMIGMLCGIAFAAGLIGSGWQPAVAVPEFTAMLCAGLFSIAGGGIGSLLPHKNN